MTKLAAVTVFLAKPCPQPAQGGGSLAVPGCQASLRECDVIRPVGGGVVAKLTDDLFVGQ